MNSPIKKLAYMDKLVKHLNYHQYWVNFNYFTEQAEYRFIVNFMPSRDESEWYYIRDTKTPRKHI